MANIEYINDVLKLNGGLDIGGVTQEIVDNPEYIEVKTDAEGRFLEGINKNGEKVFGVIPPQIKQYIDENMPAAIGGVSDIEYDETTGDMYAVYDNEGGITDVYMDANGDIYVESEE